MNPKWIDFEHGEDYAESSGYPFSLFVGEYSLIEQLRGMPAMAETFAVLYPQLSDTDFRIQVPSLEVPVYLVEGKYEAAGRETLGGRVVHAPVRSEQAISRLRELGTHPAVRRARPLRRVHERRPSATRAGTR